MISSTFQTYLQSRLRWIRAARPEKLFRQLIIIALCLGMAGNAGAQSTIFERMGSFFDDVARGLNFFGERAQDIIGPGLGFGESDAGGFMSSREFSENYPVPPAAIVNVANEFGQIRVDTWDNSVVQVLAKMRVRAESMNLASELVDKIEIRAKNAENQIELQTVLPDTRGQAGKPAIEVNYEIKIPKDASLIARNDFGDTMATGVGGSVAIDVRYGSIELRQIAGNVTVRSRGEFNVLAEGLSQGGTFELHGARATISKISGKLEVSNFQGGIELHEIGPEAEVEAVSESGPITLYLAEGDTPDLAATTLFGQINSELGVSRTMQGNFSMARSQSMESKQRISLRGTFADIAVKYERPEPLLRADVKETQPFKEVITRAETVAATDQILIEAIPGDVRVVGIDEDNVRITATRLVRVQSQSNARAALQALQFNVEKLPDTLSIKTAVTDNMAALGCVSHRVDLMIECPRTTPVSIHAQDGQTSVSDNGGNTVIRQATGSISLEHAKGVLDLVNQKGSIEVKSCAGPLEATASYGDIKLTDIYGLMKTTCSYGKTIIESPHAEIYARSTEDDIRVLSIESVAGNYDIAATNGNISILLPPTTDATISATAENGSVKSNIRLPGSVDKNVQEFLKVNPGQFRVTLQTRNGDIVIN